MTRTEELVETAQWLDERAAVLERIATASRAAQREELRLEVVRIRGRAQLLRLLASSDPPDDADRSRP